MHGQRQYVRGHPGHRRLKLHHADERGRKIPSPHQLRADLGMIVAEDFALGPAPGAMLLHANLADGRKMVGARIRDRQLADLVDQTRRVRRGRIGPLRLRGQILGRHGGGDRPPAKIARLPMEAPTGWFSQRPASESAASR